MAMVAGGWAQLEVALQMAELVIEPVNQVRFIWFGAEEAGVVGSQYYVDQLTKRQVKDIAVMLNFDMIGSTRAGSCTTATPPTPPRPARRARVWSRTCSSTPSPPSGVRLSRRRSMAGRTTTRSWPLGFRPGAVHRGRGHQAGQRQPQ